MRIVIIVLTLLWFLFGSRVCKKNFCPDHGSEASSKVMGAAGGDCISTINFLDKDSGLDLSSTENFQFMESSADVLPTSSSVADVIAELTGHLNDNPKRFMEITGLYKEDETNNSDRESLGKARASNVRSYLISKGIDGKQLTTNGLMDNTICTKEDKILRGIKVAFNEIPSN